MHVWLRNEARQAGLGFFCNKKEDSAGGWAASVLQPAVQPMHGHTGMERAASSVAPAASSACADTGTAAGSLQVAGGHSLDTGPAHGRWSGAQAGRGGAIGTPGCSSSSTIVKGEAAGPVVSGASALLAAGEAGGAAGSSLQALRLRSFSEPMHPRVRTSMNGSAAAAHADHGIVPARSSPGVSARPEGAHAGRSGLYCMLDASPPAGFGACSDTTRTVFNPAASAAAPLLQCPGHVAGMHPLHGGLGQPAAGACTAVPQGAGADGCASSAWRVQARHSARDGIGLGRRREVQHAFRWLCARRPLWPHAKRFTQLVLLSMAAVAVAIILSTVLVH